MNLLTYYKSKIVNLSEFQDFGFFWSYDQERLLS